MTREQRARDAVARHVDAGAVPGASWLVASPDGLARGTAGTHGPPEHRPIRPDTLFRISSNTKPIAAALAMTLVDDGTVDLDAPVDDLLPELADRRVMIDPAGPIDETVPAARPISVRDVLEFRLGWGMDFTGPNVLLSAMADRGLSAGPPAPQANPAPDEWIRRLGGLPLAHQPGERWLYSVGASVLGVLLARAAGTALPELLEVRLTGPLGMRDTAFWVPEDRLGRLGPHWVPDQDGGAATVYDPPEGQWSRRPAFADAADGLVSTVHDLAAFAGMLAAGGVTGDGTRVLSEAAVGAMTTDQVGPVDPAGGGWGLGLGVRVADAPDGRHAGTYGWDGGMGSTCWTDPESGVTAILLTNQMWPGPVPPPIFGDFLASAFGSAD